MSKNREETGANEWRHRKRVFSDMFAYISEKPLGMFTKSRRNFNHNPTNDFRKGFRRPRSDFGEKTKIYFKFDVTEA